MTRTPRTLPPWVRSVDHDDMPDLPSTPDNVRVAAPVLRGAHPRPEAPRGRRFDYARTAEPVLPSSPVLESGARWKDFMGSVVPSSTRPSTGRTVVDDEWMEKNWPYNFDDPWEPSDRPPTPSPSDKEGKPLLLNWKIYMQRKAFIKRAYRLLMTNPFVPLLFRLTVLIFSVLAVGLAGSLYNRTNRTSAEDALFSCRRLSSTYMAISFGAVAIVYVIYITVDEYTSQPLGLRSHSAKMRLIFLDLIFIVFNSANLALAFEPLFDSTWACQPSDDNKNTTSLASRSNTNGTGGNVTSCEQNTTLCHKQKALSGTLVVALVAWLVTFAISTLRIVERVVEREKLGRE